MNALLGFLVGLGRVLVALVILIVLFPRLLLRLFRDQTTGRAGRAKVGHAAARVEITDASPVVAERDALFQKAGDLVRAGQASALIEMFRQADSTNATLEDGTPRVDILEHGAFETYYQVICDKDFRSAEHRLEQFKSVFDTRLDDPIVATVIARLHTRLAEGYRGHQFINRVSQTRLDAFSHHVETAHDLLKPFDPVALNSAFMASTRYALVFGLENASAQIEGWYHDWCDIVPRSAAPHALHAHYMSPVWFGGDFVRYAETARVACLRHPTLTGSQPYFVYMLHAQQCYPDWPVEMDIELFLEGARDYIALAPNQTNVNRVAVSLTNLIGTLSRIDSDAARGRRDKVVAALREVMTTRLQHFQLGEWMNERNVLNTLAVVFKDELDTGLHLRSGVSGIEPYRPKGTRPEPEAQALATR